MYICTGYIIVLVRFWHYFYWKYKKLTKQLIILFIYYLFPIFLIKKKKSYFKRLRVKMRWNLRKGHIDNWFYNIQGGKWQGFVGEVTIRKNPTFTFICFSFLVVKSLSFHFPPSALEWHFAYRLRLIINAYTLLHTIFHLVLVKSKLRVWCKSANVFTLCAIIFVK